MNDTITHAYYHLAILDTNRLPLLVSCVTLEPPYKVPPGKQFNVSFVYMQVDSNLTHIYFPHHIQVGIDLRLKGVNDVYVFVSNKNEESDAF